MKNQSNQINFKMAFVMLCLLTTSIIFSQEKPYRIGVKIGFPNVVGGNIEYVTPLLQKKLSVFVDYSGIKADSFLEGDDSENATGKFRYFEAGANYYFTKEGKGFYGGLSYGNFKISGTVPNVESDNGVKTNGKGIIDVSSSAVNLKVGAKLGGSFYFRPEIGFALSGFPKNIDMDVTFPDNSSEVQNVANSDDIPSIISSGLMINLGFGFSF